MKLDKKKIKDHLTTKFIGSDIYIYGKVESTNDIAKELTNNGCKEGTVIIADLQSKGRGRQGRRWESPEGVGIYLSIVLKPEKIIPQLTLVAGVSAAEAIITSCKLQVTSNVILSEAKNLNRESRIFLKWPNDININGKKAGGILTEAIENGKAIIVGIGINVNTELSMFTDELKNKATSIMMETGKRVDRNLLIAELLNRFEYWYKKFNVGQGFSLANETVIKRWKELSDTSGRRVKVNVGDSVFEGVALGLDNDGSLMIRLDDGFLKKVSAGEICY
ncbi:MAG: biotin--[acetyl-CoA-carboxylase] ligase [Nitrospinae bacterium RIFCSPLOWO2_02_39_17]|nr:MAG: biotin--[acetyl-CoA-carboxylase] ligase [Nitrospinae bacterium RIFCSPHIGHO2_02_39_11]OGV97978.1 MAG: biotin--[acetyl-CoA-carboxylase] ligase [Nitrospinae bacterium RIFCSPHIGHO2_12_FULL_39_42]OGW03503.1 MAG: biotin--[acetyl-CoA-carboxylase] ligase [Nitrospinae bacterium RIFCSPLOWO2_02_39_17]OGW09559.1 MAG: biotin--[acetyl-CoA-carboxylase] ligase [Nitrospinae bacterium RIFCSPLOWO2_12_39_15]